MSLAPEFIQASFRHLMLRDFLNLSTREHHHQVQKSTLGFENLYDHQNSSNLPLWWWLSSNTPLQHYLLEIQRPEDLNASPIGTGVIITHKLSLIELEHSYLFMAPELELMPHSTDRLCGITEEHFGHMQEALLYDEGRTNDVPVVRLKLPWQEMSALLSYLHMNWSRGMFCTWCVGRREVIRADTELKF